MTTLGLSIFCAAAVLCWSCPGFSKKKDAGWPLSGWATSFDEAERFKSAQLNISQYETLWFFNPSIKSLIESPDSWWPAQSNFQDLYITAVKRKMSFGPVLHNSTDSGFDGKLGVSFLKSKEQALNAIDHMVKVHHWTALNIDFESLPPDSAELFEDFLSALKLKFPGLKISVCLHAQTGDGAVFEGARFQRWNKLKDLDVDFVIMAYDFSWNTSAPGPVAPLVWAQKVVRFALKNFDAKKIVIALPLYGYHWRRNDKGVSWTGKSDSTFALQGQVVFTSWKKDVKVAKSDGVLYRKGDKEVIAFDNEVSFREKSRLIRKMGIERFAVWRVGAEADSFYLIKE